MLFDCRTCVIFLYDDAYSSFSWCDFILLFLVLKFTTVTWFIDKVQLIEISVVYVPLMTCIEVQIVMPFSSRFLLNFVQNFNKNLLKFYYIFSQCFSKFENFMVRLWMLNMTVYCTEQSHYVMLVCLCFELMRCVFWLLVNSQFVQMLST